MPLTPHAPSIRLPRLLSTLSILMIAFPVIYFPFASFIFELKSKGLLSLVLSPLFYISSFFWVITGIGIRRLKQWSWRTFLAAQVFLLYLNALNLVNHSESNTKGWAFALTVLAQIYVLLVLSRQFRVPFVFPRIQWWESGLASMPHLSVEVFHVASPTGTSTAQLLDMNLMGCFIKSPAEFEPYEKIKVRFESYGQKVDVAGVVVWRAKSTVTHPKGIGVQFSELDRNRKRKVRILTKRFEKERQERKVFQSELMEPETDPFTPEELTAWVGAFDGKIGLLEHQKLEKKELSSSE